MSTPVTPSTGAAPTTAAPATQTPSTDSSQVASSAGKTVNAVGAADVQEILAEENGSDVQATETQNEKQIQKEINDLKKKFKLKVNGKEIEKEFDLSNEEQLKNYFQKAEAAEQTWQEAAKVKKQMQAIGQMLQNDPFALMREAGLDPDELTAKYMENRLKEMEKSPEQRQLEELQKEIEKERKQRQALEEEKTNAEQERIRSEYMRDLDDQITGALSGAELPKSPYVVKRIAEYLAIGLDQGKQLTVQQVVPLVQKSIKAEIREMFEAMPEDVIEGVLGDNVLSKMKKRRLAKMKEVQSASNIKQTGQSEMAKLDAKNNKPKEKIPAKDFWNKVRG